MSTDTVHPPAPAPPSPDPGPDPRVLVAPAVGAGLLFAGYLLLRPYGDASGADTLAAARAFASPWWLVSHLCGALALACVGRLALRLHDIHPSGPARAARWTGLAGAVLVLPYYGAETFALHVLGRAALAGDPGALDLAGLIRDQSVAMTTFGLGLLLLAAAGLLIAVAWQRTRPADPAWLGWPFGVLTALFLPQYYLPPTGRMVFGILFGVAALALAAAALRHGPGTGRDVRSAHRAGGRLD